MQAGTLTTNNLDLVRFALAMTVLLVHGHVLSGEPALAALSAVLSSDLAVKAFFVVSGLLVTMSYERSTSLADYVEKRVRRIYPAYVVVIVLSALVLLRMTSVVAGEYFSSDWWRYVAANLAFANFLQPTLPGVFETNPVRDVNGALWTLKIEVMFYAVVPAIVWATRRWRPWPVLATLYIASVAYRTSMIGLADGGAGELYRTLAHQLPGQLGYFAGGTALYHGLAWIQPRLGWAVAAGAAAWLGDRMLGLAWLEPLWVTALVAAVGFGHYLGNFGRRGDVSYGVYILHFPVVQVLVVLGVFHRSPWGALALSAAIVVGAAFVLWHLVERPGRTRSSHYVRSTKAS